MCACFRLSLQMDLDYRRKRSGGKHNRIEFPIGKKLLAELLLKSRPRLAVTGPLCRLRVVIRFGFSIDSTCITQYIAYSPWQMSRAGTNYVGPCGQDMKIMLRQRSPDVSNLPEQKRSSRYATEVSLHKSADT